MNIFKKVETDEHIEKVERLARVIWKDYFSSMIGEETVEYLLENLQSRQAISGQIRDGYQYYLIQPESNPVGYFAILDKKVEIFLSKLYILDSERGRGYGKAAMDFIETLAHEKSCKKISLTVFHKNEKAIAAYEKMGFRHTGSVIRDVGNSVQIHDFSMEKIVTNP